ncbi:MAG: hypothetical protein EXR62_00110 [Chloroflexi bacterium]|nr:hypothetical protein [Chloroflexota bacterium]
MSRSTWILLLVVPLVFCIFVACSQSSPTVALPPTSQPAFSGGGIAATPHLTSPVALGPQNYATPATVASLPVQPRLLPPAQTPLLGAGRLGYILGKQVWLANLENGQMQQITQSGIYSYPRFSPDGRYLTYYRQDGAGGLPELWLAVVAPDIAITSTLLDTSLPILDAGYAPGPQWNPAPSTANTALQALVYPGPDGSLVRREIGGGNLPGRDTSRMLLLPAGSGVRSVAWSPDGQQLAIERWVVALGRSDGLIQEQGIYLMPATGGDLRLLYTSLTSLDQRAAYLHSWSPNSRYLALWSGPISPSLMSDGLSVVVVPVDRSRPPRTLGTALVQRSFLAWSPDGKDLAVTEGPGREILKDKHVIVYPVSVPGDPLNLSRDSSEADTWPVWSPDGQSIAYVSGPSLPFSNDPATKAAALLRRTIWRVGVISTAKKKMTGVADQGESGYTDDAPVWTRNGQHLIYVRFLGERGEVWWMRADGSQPGRLVRQLDVPPEYYGWHDWFSVLDIFR